MVALDDLPDTPATAPCELAQGVELVELDPVGGVRSGVVLLELLREQELRLDLLLRPLEAAVGARRRGGEGVAAGLADGQAGRLRRAGDGIAGQGVLAVL